VAWREPGEKEAKARCVTFTFDTGMLIALERRKQRATQAFRNIVRRGFLPVVPAVVYVEWWRGQSDIREDILAAVLVEDMPPPLCRAAGQACMTSIDCNDTFHRCSSFRHSERARRAFPSPTGRRAVLEWSLGPSRTLVAHGRTPRPAHRLDREEGRGKPLPTFPHKTKRRFDRQNECEE
jgi:hypothetical protein